MANYPLEIICPVASATSSRPHFAYPNLEYNIRAGVIGGMYPYYFRLVQAPSGMSVRDDGTVVWPSPTVGAHSITLAVRDQENTTAQVSWTINCQTSGFQFIDSSQGQNISNLSGSGIAYFREGDYDVLNLTRRSVGSNWERIEFSDSNFPTKWIAYPGENPVLDFGYRQIESGSGTGSTGLFTDTAKAWQSNGFVNAYLIDRQGFSFRITANSSTQLTVTGNPQSGVYTITTEVAPLIRLNGNDHWIDGINFTNARIMAFQPGGERSVFRRFTATQIGPGADGSNSSLIMTVNSGANLPTLVSNMLIQEITMYDFQSTMLGKFYTRQKMLVEDNHIYQGYNDYNFADSFGLEFKFDCRQYTARNNLIHDIVGKGIGGNMNSNDGEVTPRVHGEICFNTLYGLTDNAIEMGQDADVGKTDCYRNSVIGNIRLWNLGIGDGPVSVTDNVVVGSINYDNVTDRSVVTESNNLVGTTQDNILDNLGKLTPAYQSNLGRVGAEIASFGLTTELAQNFDLVGTTLISKDGRTEIGDAEQENFFPQFKFKKRFKVENESNISIRPILSDYTPTALFNREGDVIFIRDEIMLKFGADQNGANMKIVLFSQPPTNTMDFSINTKDAQLWHQPALNNPTSRPIDVDNSIVISHPSKRNNEYQSGKIGHLYRYQASDVNNTTAWCDWSIIDQSTIRLTIPTNYLTTATYPVTLGSIRG